MQQDNNDQSSGMDVEQPQQVQFKLPSLAQVEARIAAAQLLEQQKTAAQIAAPVMHPIFTA